MFNYIYNYFDLELETCSESNCKEDKIALVI